MQFLALVGGLVVAGLIALGLFHYVTSTLNQNKTTTKRKK